MSLEYEKRLQAEVARELRSLKDVPAPATLPTRVMAAIKAREQRAWIRNPWPIWPTPLRCAAFLGLWVLFGGLCLASWHLGRSEWVTTAVNEAGRWLVGAAALGRGLSLVGRLFTDLLKNMQPSVLLGCLAAVGLAYGVFVALATCYLRLGLAAATDEPYETTPK